MFCNKFHAVTKRSQMHPNTTKCTETLVLGPMVWISAFVAKNYNVTSWHELLHYLIQVTPFCTEFQAVTKRSQIHPNTMKHTKTWDYGPMGWIKCVRCEKLQHHFVARTFALIEPVLYVLHQVSCSYETIPNAPKYYEMHRNISFLSNWAGLGVFFAKNYNVTSWHELLH